MQLTTRLLGKTNDNAFLRFVRKAGDYGDGMDRPTQLNTRRLGGSVARHFQSSVAFLALPHRTAHSQLHNL